MAEETQEKKPASEKKSTAKLNLDADKIYQFKSNGKSKHMPADEVYEVTAEMAEILVSKKYGEIL